MRVYELAKELELSSKDMLDWLKAHDYDAKSASSSVEDDQATAVKVAIANERKPAAAPAPKPTGSGVVLRRKKTAEGEAPAQAIAAPEPTPPVVEPVPDVVVERAPAEIAAPVVEPVVAAAPVAPAAEVVVAPPSLPESVVPAQHAAPIAAAGATPATHSHLPPGVMPAVVGVAPPKQAPYTPGIQAGHVAAQPGVDPKTLKPTATQAVVISRPAFITKRVTPLSTAPTFQPRPQPRELQVVPGALGAGREFIDVTKDKKGKRGPRLDKVETLSKQDLVDLARQRAYVPVHGKKKRPTKKGKKTEITEMSAHKKVISIEETITVAELSQKMGVKSSDLIRKLMEGVAGGAPMMATVNKPIDIETATLLATPHGWEVKKVGFEVGEYIADEEVDEAALQPRPPVVTIMGHVDHGKTSLLDAIRSADVATGEAGGITQHIGAYSVYIDRENVKGDITFLDTPGHEAFTAMRARGANATDIAVLVVGADDGVQPQTVESIKHAKVAGVPIVVALNKCDKKEAQADRVRQQLTEHGLVDEKWGGDTLMIEVSARQKTNIDLLLESILLQAEVLELKANPTRPSEGVIIEAKLEKGRGPVATVLVQDGTLKVGDALVTGTHHGRIRAMMNDKGESVTEVPPGYPVEVLGLSGVPRAGDVYNIVESERAAKEVADHRALKARQADLSKSSKISLEDLFKKTAVVTQKDLRLVIKADVQGSAEAVSAALQKLTTPKVKVTVVHQAVGTITESDVNLAAAAGGMIVGFGAKPESGALQTAQREGVTVRIYSIIYEAIDDVRLAMENLLEPIIKERVLGRAEVRATFNVPKQGTIAGAAVVDGKVSRRAMIRLLRDNKAVFTGKVSSLRRLKDDVSEVDKGLECGIGIENYTDMKPGDIIEAYELESTRQSLN